MFQSLMKKIYGRFNGKLFPIVAKPMSWFALCFLLIVKRKKQKIVLLASAIGDVLYSLSFLEVFSRKEQNTDQKILIVGSDRYKEIFESYHVKPSNAMFLAHCGVLHLFELALACNTNNFKKSLVSKIAYKHGIYLAIPGACSWYANSEIIGNRNILSDMYDVPIEPISYHGMGKKKVVAISDFEVKKSKICVVNPYSFSMNVPIEKFEKMCNRLKKMGYLVYTNVVGKQQVIAGTEPLRCGLPELFSIACEIPLFVSIRSGVLDFLIPSNVNMFVIYVKNDAEDALIAKHYSLREWKPKGFVEEVYFDVGIEDEVLSNKFASYLHKLKLEEQ